MRYSIILQSKKRHLQGIQMLKNKEMVLKVESFGHFFNEFLDKELLNPDNLFVSQSFVIIDENFISYFMLSWQNVRGVNVHFLQHTR